MAPKKNKEEELPILYNYYQETEVRKIHHFYISSQIGEPEGYVDMIHKIQASPPSDVVYIHLNTSGGQLDTGIQIINAIQISQAHVICSIEAECHSLGSLIFLSADEFIVHDNCVMMLHNFSGTTLGKGNEQVAQLTATMKWFSMLAKKLYIPFINEEEFDRIFKGEDLWFQSDEIRERLNTMVELLKQQEKKQRKPRKVKRQEVDEQQEH